MNKRTAIRECKKLWEEIEESGLTKQDFMDSSAGKKWVDRGYEMDCPLCEYSWSFGGGCPKCPLMVQYDEDCYGLGFEDSGKVEPGFFDAIRGLKC